MSLTSTLQVEKGKIQLTMGGTFKIIFSTSFYRPSIVFLKELATEPRPEHRFPNFYISELVTK